MTQVKRNKRNDNTLYIICLKNLSYNFNRSYEIFYIHFTIKIIMNLPDFGGSNTIRGESRFNLNSTVKD